jgi:hypothetical protein
VWRDRPLLKQGWFWVCGGKQIDGIHALKLVSRKS